MNASEFIALVLELSKMSKPRFWAFLAGLLAVAFLWAAPGVILGREAALVMVAVVAVLVIGVVLAGLVADKPPTVSRLEAITWNPTFQIACVAGVVVAIEFFRRRR